VKLQDKAVPIQIDQGATFTWPITYLNSDESPVVLTGYTAKMQVRQTAEASGSAIVNLTTENGGITITGPLGLITVIISEAQTAALPAPFEGVYDLLVYSTAGVVEKLLYGPAKVVPVVTR